MAVTGLGLSVPPLMLQLGDPGGLFPPERFPVLACLVVLLGELGRARCAMVRPEMGVQTHPEVTSPPAPPDTSLG